MRPKPEELTTDRKNEAIRLFNSGKTLNEVADIMGVGLYDVSFIVRLAVKQIMASKVPTNIDEPIIIKEI